MYSHKEINEYMKAYRGLKKIAAKVCIKLSAPVIRILNQEFSLIQNVLERHELMLDKSRQMQTRLEACEEMTQPFRQLIIRFEEASENIRQLNRRLEGYEEQADVCRQLAIRFGEASENISQLNRRLQGYEEQAENIRKLNHCLEGYEKVAETVGELTADLKYRMDKIESHLDMHTVKIMRMQKPCSLVQNSQKDAAEKTKKQESGTSDEHTQNAYSSIDYFDFENHFRGSRNAVKKSQQIYLDYFRDKKHVLDIGCGRGEFLELMKENGIQGYGVDAYQEFVELCRYKQLEAVYGDAFDILEKERELDGIFAAQFIEHIHFEQLVRLLELAYERLIPGSYLVLETQNPMSLAIYANAFYIDPSHNKPVHPLTVQYLLEKIGFSEISVLFTENSRLPFEIPRLNIEHVENIEKFNEAMAQAGRMLFGSQDYAIVAKR